MSKEDFDRADIEGFKRTGGKKKYKNRKLIKNMEEYDKKKEAKQQESKILVSREKRRTKN